LDFGPEEGAFLFQRSWIFGFIFVAENFQVSYPKPPPPSAMYISWTAAGSGRHIMDGRIWSCVFCD
jgi:hypothetical protein